MIISSFFFFLKEEAGIEKKLVLGFKPCPLPFLWGVPPPLAAIATVTVPLTVAPADGLVNDAVSGGGAGGGVPPVAAGVGIDAPPGLPVGARGPGLRTRAPAAAPSGLPAVETGPVLAGGGLAPLWAPPPGGEGVA